MPYEILQGKPASYKYLRVWRSPAYVKRLVGDKLDSRCSLCRFSNIRKKLRDITLMIPSKQKIFILRNAVFLKKYSSVDSQRNEMLLEEPRLTSQLDNDPRTYGEEISDIDSGKWLEAMKFKMDSMGSNHVWTLVDPPKGVRPVGCNWVYKYKLETDGEVAAFKTRLVAKGYTQRPGVDFDETYSFVAMAKSIRILLAIAAWYDYEIRKMNVKTAFLNGFVGKRSL
ncbi:UNVERIFIED_CONTAM: putative mitochondrial protein [Sesamum latifolium]|uniref:Mitochondrial protein n=1 Tax=Sesamum latifolium TaxID=2727402 RepID=A0AAW2U3F8_9LAMI